MILVGLGLRIDAFSAFGVEVKLGIFAYPVTVFWIVLVVNAFNLVDGMDGFCGSLGLVAALGTAFLAYRSGLVGDAILGLALAGALAAFLKDNLPPAKVYLGDAGSMTIGLMISALSVRACSAGPNNAISFPPLVALLTLPLLDVVTAIVRRSITGRSVFTPDRGHIHHCLRSRLGSKVAALVAAVGLATLGAGGAALAKVDGMGNLATCLAIVITVGLLVGTNTFGRSESRLLLFRIRTALSPLVTGGAVRRGGSPAGVPPPRHPGLGGRVGRPDPRGRGRWGVANRACHRPGRRWRGLPRPLDFAGGVGRRSELVGRPQPLRRGCPGGSPARGGQHRRVSVPPSRQGGGARPDAGGPARIGRPSPVALRGPVAVSRADVRTVDVNVALGVRFSSRLSVLERFSIA